MKIEIKWTEVMSEGQPCKICADDCSFRCVVEYREEKPDLASCSLGIGVATNVVEGLKPTSYCPGPGVYVREDGIKGLVELGPFDVVVTVPEPQPDSQGKMIVYKCPVNAIECPWTHQNGFGGNINWCVPGPGCPRHPDAPIMDRGRMVEPGPYDIMVGGVKVGEIPEPNSDGLCSAECLFLNNALDVRFACKKGFGVTVRSRMEHGTRDYHFCKPDRKCPRHPDHGKAKL